MNKHEEVRADFAGFAQDAGASHEVALVMFDAMIREVRAAAWEEGRLAGQEDEQSAQPENNPYREES